MHRSTHIVIGLLSLVTWPASAYLPPTYGGIVTATLPDRPVTLDPAQATRASELMVVPLVYDSLFRVGRKGGPRPHLLDGKPKVSADGKTWRLRLRSGVRVNGNITLEASHVVASLRRLRKGPNAYLLARVRALSAEGKDVVVVALRRPAPTLPYVLSAPATAIVVTNGRRLLGTGPYVLASKSSTLIQLKANPSHFAGRPYLDELRFRLFSKASAESVSFQVGALQLSYQGAPVFGSKPRFPSREMSSPPLDHIFLGVGRRQPYLSDPLFRRALQSGIDRRRLAKLVGSGKAPLAHGPVSRRLMRRSSRAVAFDRGAARRMLQRAAVRYPALRGALGGGRLKVSLLVDSSRFGDRILAGQIVADLDRIGITCTIEALPAMDYRSRLASGRFDLVLGHQALQVPLGGVALAGAHALARDPGSARQCMVRGCGARAVARFMKRLPLIPLLHATVRVHHNTRLGGVHTDTTGRILYESLYWRRTGP